MLYQRTKSLAQRRACSSVSKPRAGNRGRYLAVRKSASACALSFDTPGARVGRLQPQPAEHGEDGGGFQGRTVVAMEHGFVGQGMDAFGERGAPDQVGGVIGVVSGLDGEADDIAAV